MGFVDGDVRVEILLNVRRIICSGAESLGYIKCEEVSSDSQN